MNTLAALKPHLKSLEIAQLNEFFVSAEILARMIRFAKAEQGRQMRRRKYTKKKKKKELQISADVFFALMMK